VAIWLETSGTDAVDALLIFLNLLEADAKLVAELRLPRFVVRTRRSRIRFPSSMSGFRHCVASSSLPLICSFWFYVLRSRIPEQMGQGSPYITL